MPKPKTRTPLWKGPDVDGITQSLLGRFLECRERFRLKVVDGLAEDEGFSRPLEFGNLWHTAEEAYLGGHDWLPPVEKYRRRLEQRYPNDLNEIMKWFKVTKTTFPIYLEYWAKQKDEKDAKPILEEKSFAVPYTLPSGRTVLLRGKWDALRLLPLPQKRGKWGIYIKEHKTKGEIDEDGILKTLAWNMQTMMYQIALRTLRDLLDKYETKVHAGTLFKEFPSMMVGMRFEDLKTIFKATSKHPPAGVIYNVVRRPLADRYAIKQKKMESIDQFYRRLGDVIKTDSFDSKGKPKQKSNYFMRWKVELTDEDVDKFKNRTFHPILESLMDWWEEIKLHPFDPWGTCKHHYQSPWGVHNSLAGGFRGSFFEYLTSGRDYGLIQNTTLFPELA